MFQYIEFIVDCISAAKYIDYSDFFSQLIGGTMRLSSKGEYGLLAAVDLAINVGRGPVQSFQIAARQKIPKQYLDQLLLTLKKAGLVESSRGRQGGYQLAKPASDISIFDIVAALEGPIDKVNFQAKSPHEKSSAHQMLREVWSEVVHQSVKILKQKTLDEFRDRHRRTREEIMYYI